VLGAAPSAGKQAELTDATATLRTSVMHVPELYAASAVALLSAIEREVSAGPAGSDTEASVLCWSEVSRPRRRCLCYGVMGRERVDCGRLCACGEQQSSGTAVNPGPC
jgi:hypothetical protein